MPPLTLGLFVFELIVMVFAISLHGYAQAWMAKRQGDPTALMMGRVTMNPAMHYDMWGTVIWPLLCLFLFHGAMPYGWGKPVPMTYRNFRNKNGEVISTLAGPAAQFLAAVVALVILLVLKHTMPAANETLLAAVLLANHQVVGDLSAMPGIFPVLLVLYLAIMVNLLLCIFNLLPMPFLDGGKILRHFLNYNAAQAFDRYQMYFMIAFFLVGGVVVGFVFDPLMAIFTNLLIRL